MNTRLSLRCSALMALTQRIEDGLAALSASQQEPLTQLAEINALLEERQLQLEQLLGQPGLDLQQPEILQLVDNLRARDPAILATLKARMQAIAREAKALNKGNAARVAYA